MQFWTFCSSNFVCDSVLLFCRPAFAMASPDLDTKMGLIEKLSVKHSLRCTFRWIMNANFRLLVLPSRGRKRPISAALLLCWSAFALRIEMEEKEGKTFSERRLGSAIRQTAATTATLSRHDVVNNTQVYRCWSMNGCLLGGGEKVFPFSAPNSSPSYSSSFFGWWEKRGERRQKLTKPEGGCLVLLRRESIE